MTDVVVPPGGSVGRRLPLMLALHGLGQTGTQYALQTKLTPVAARNHFIVAYPSGYNRAWDAQGTAALDDTRFLGALIDRVEMDLCVDAGRIYVTGTSLGGGMAYSLGCALGDRIAAIAPLAAAFFFKPKCDSARPMPTLIVQSIHDPVLDYATYAKPIVAQMVRRNGCDTRRARRVMGVGTMFTWQGCKAGAKLEIVRLTAIRHGIPGVVAGDPGQDIAGPAAIWTFLSQFTLPRPRPN